MEKTAVFNPFLPSWEYVPDGEPRVFGDRIYVYGSHDRFDGNDFCLGDYVGWSAPLWDLGQWRYEGVIYRASQDPQNKKGNMHMCAPDCVQGTDGRYYLYYQLHLLTCTSVAVSDSPVGPFEYYGCVQHPDGTPYGNKKGDYFAFDPGVLVDDDGRVYCYVGFAPTGGFRRLCQMRGNNVDGSVCLELMPDMKTICAEPKLIAPGPVISAGTGYEGHAFFEASSIRKIGDTYYYVYSSELSHELCYATGKYPDRDFVYGGTLISIGDLGFHGNTTPLNYLGNTHGGMVCVNGQWYIFYHRQTNRQKCARQACAEKITIASDGTIAQTELTGCGLNDGPLPAKGTYEARIACNLSSRMGVFTAGRPHEKDRKHIHPYFTQSGSDREGDGDQYIANLTDGAWAGFKYFAFDGTETTLSVVCRGQAQGVLEVSLARDADPVCTPQLSPTEQWTEFAASLPEISGTQALYFRYRGKGSADFITFTVQ